MSNDYIPGAMFIRDIYALILRVHRNRMPDVDAVYARTICKFHLTNTLMRLLRTKFKADIAL